MDSREVAGDFLKKPPRLLHIQDNARFCRTRQSSHDEATADPIGRLQPDNHLRCLHARIVSGTYDRSFDFMAEGSPLHE